MASKLIRHVAILTSALLVSSHLFAADSDKEYSGCGTDSNQARLELSKNLSSLVQSETAQETEVVGNSLLGIFSFDSVLSTTTDKSKIESSINLCDVSIVERDGQQCALVKHSSLVSCAKNNLDKQLDYKTSRLPKQETGKRETAEKWLRDIISNEGLYTFVRSELNKEKLSQLSNIENELKKILNKQFVLFQLVSEDTTITINDSMDVKPNQYVSLPVGKHSYKLGSPSHCTVKDSFDLNSKNKKVIAIDLSDFSYPEYTFTSNQTGAALMVDGKSERLGSTIVIKKCDGMVNYAFNFEGNTEDGKLTLKPGVKQEVRETFVSKAEMQRNSKLVENYKQSHLWQVQFQHFALNHKTQGVDSISGIKLAKNRSNNAIRYGYELIYGQDDDDNFVAEINGKLKLQLLTFGKNDTPLHLGSVVFIPHIGIDLGLGYHELDGNSEYDDPDSSNWQTFYRSYIVARPNVGVDLPFSKDFGISLEYGRSLYMNESDTISLGLNIRTNL